MRCSSSMKVEAWQDIMFVHVLRSLGILGLVTRKFYPGGGGDGGHNQRMMIVSRLHVCQVCHVTSAPVNQSFAKDGCYHL